jgi:hypothetical protein
MKGTDMRSALTYLALAILTCATSAIPADEGQWQSLFDGKSLEGWKAADHDECFTVKDDAIAAGGGPMTHLAYVGPVGNHDFKNFEIQLEVMTKPGSNGGIFFHTQLQSGSLKKGYEAQISNSHSDKRRTGSLLAIDDVDPSPVKDNEWFDYHILVSGKRIVLKINGTTTVDYTEPAKLDRPKGREQRVLSRGTIALQAHDPNGMVFYRNIRIKLLPD